MAAKKEARKAVIVGSLLDWPLGAKLATLLGLPEAVTRLGAYQVSGHHGDEVAAAVRAVKEQPSPEVKAAGERLLAALHVCAFQRARYSVGFHGSLSPEELRARLDETYLVRSPAEAAEARTRTPAKSLSAIAKAMESASGLPKKRVLAWLEKGGKMIEADADALAYVFVADPEASSEVDRRLLSLWANNLTAVSTRFPTPSPGAPELGFDRLGLYIEGLTAAGLAPAVIERLLLTRWAQQVRMFPSTGVRVWEQLARDPQAFSQRVLDQPDGAHHLVSVLAALLELPAQALDAGAGDLVRRFCADASLVPEETLEKLRKDPAYRAILGTLERHGTPVTGRPFGGGVTSGVPLRDLTA